MVLVLKFHWALFSVPLFRLERNWIIEQQAWITQFLDNFWSGSCNNSLEKISALKYFVQFSSKLSAGNKIKIYCTQEEVLVEILLLTSSPNSTHIFSKIFSLYLLQNLLFISQNSTSNMSTILFTRIILTKTLPIV